MSPARQPSVRSPSAAKAPPSNGRSATRSQEGILRFANPHFPPLPSRFLRSEEHTSELQSLMRISYAVFCLKKKNQNYRPKPYQDTHTIQQQITHNTRR